MSTSKNIARQLSVENGLDIRNPASSILGLNSRDRYETTLQSATLVSSPFNCVLSSKQNFMVGFFQRIALTEICFTWALPTLTSARNKMYINVAGTDYLLTIPQTYYTPTTLAAAFELEVQAIGGGTVLPSFTCAVDPQTSQFTAASNTVDTFFFKTYSAVTKVSNPDATTVFEMMNWNSYSIGGAIAAAAQISGIPSMLPTQFIDIVCSQITANQDVKDGTSQSTPRDVLARVYFAADATTLNPELLGSVPFKIYKQYTYPKQIKFDPLMPIQGFLRFEIFDDAGDLLTSGIDFVDAGMPDWQITLLVSET